MIGQMYYCNLFAGERYYLRLLLTSVTGPKSFENLRTIDNHLYLIFHATYVALGLLENDREWVSCFTEASLFSSGKTLRTLIVSILTYGSISDLSALWEEFWAKICDDLPHRLQGFTNIPAGFEDPHFDYGLYLINQDLRRMDKSCTDFALLSPILNWETHQQNLLI